MAEKNESDLTTSEKQCVVGLGFCGPGAGANTSVADVKDGKLVRLRPLHLDWKYDPKQFNTWKMEARGKSFEPRLKSLIPPFSLAYKKRVYSSNRVLYPLKRVDFDPNGERHPENRGKSKYKRISWDEALDIIESEIRRIHENYGPYAILPQWGGHGETKVVHNPHGYPNALLNLMGGYTFEVRNPDSWEGWHWGAMHAWGMPPVGQPQSANCMLDVARNSDLLLFWGCDPETTPWGIDGLAATRLCYWYSELGIDSVYICPDLNYGAAVHADKWIPIRPGTDAALQLAVAYIWITEGTYDKEYVATHTFGYEKFEDYVLGKEDGVPKTPEWASEKCGITPWTIKALAHQWAKQATSITHGNGGPGIRSAYSTENGRLEVFLLAMQGLGGPGKHYVKMIEWWQFCQQNPMPNAKFFPSIVGAMANMPKVRRFNMDGGKCAPPASSPPPPAGETGKDGEDVGPMITPPQFRSVLPKNLVHDALNKESISFYGTARVGAPIADQFVKYTFPAEGCPRIHMIWTDSPCYTTCWNDSNAYHQGVRNPDIEFIVAQHPWLESDCYFADVILPVATKFELEDIDCDPQNGQHSLVSYQKQAIEPLGESKSDFEVVGEVAKRFGLYEQFTNDRVVSEMIEDGFYGSGVSELVSFEEWKEKGYVVVPTDPDWDKVPPGMRGFHDDPEAITAAYSLGQDRVLLAEPGQALPRRRGAPPGAALDREGRVSRRTHLERARREVSVAGPLQPPALARARQRRRHHLDPGSAHLQGEGLGRLPLRAPMDAPAGCGRARHRRRRHPQASTTSGVRSLPGPTSAERVMPGAVSIDHGARYDPIVAGEFDRGGAINTITPHNSTSQERHRHGVFELPGGGGEGDRDSDERVESEVSGSLQPAL